MSRIRMDSVPPDVGLEQGEAANGGQQQDMAAQSSSEAGEAPLRQCGHCGKQYPATTDHFHRDPRGGLGLSSICKECRREHYRKRRDPGKRSEGRSPATGCVVEGIPSMVAGSVASVEMGDKRFEVLSLSLEGYPEIMPALHDRARREIRTPAEQAIWELRNALCGGAA